MIKIVSYCDHCHRFRNEFAEAKLESSYPTDTWKLQLSLIQSGRAGIRINLLTSEPQDCPSLNSSWMIFLSQQRTEIKI